MSIQVTPDPLEEGKDATVCVEGSSQTPGTKITVQVTDGEEHVDSIEIVIDENGSGCATWTVPDWGEAHFTYSTCEKVVRPIIPASDWT